MCATDLLHLAEDVPEQYFHLKKKKITLKMKREICLSCCMYHVNSHQQQQNKITQKIMTSQKILPYRSTSINCSSAGTTPLMYGSGGSPRKLRIILKKERIDGGGCGDRQLQQIPKWNETGESMTWLCRNVLLVRLHSGPILMYIAALTTRTWGAQLQSRGVLHSSL